MNSTEIQSWVYEWATSGKFNAPYGVILGDGTSKSGKPYRSVTFGYARTLDAIVMIYNRKFIVVNTSRHGNQTFKSFDDLKVFLETL